MWTDAEAYDQLMGRWSRRLAPALIEFAGVDDGDRVLDIGCGTGSLTQALLESQTNIDVVGVDPASAYIKYARQRLAGKRAILEQADAQSLPFDDNSFDKCLSLLVLNFVPDAPKAVSETYRITRPGGVAAAVVWDYGEGMEMLRIMWDAAVALDPAAESKDERNMPYCRRGELATLWRENGFQRVDEDALITTLDFPSFDDYWAPFLTGVGPSGAYVSALSAARRSSLRKRLRDLLAFGREDRPFSLQARAWAVRGFVRT